MRMSHRLGRRCVQYRYNKFRMTCSVENTSSILRWLVGACGVVGGGRENFQPTGDVVVGEHVLPCSACLAFSVSCPPFVCHASGMQGSPNLTVNEKHKQRAPKAILKTFPSQSLYGVISLYCISVV